MSLILIAVIVGVLATPSPSPSPAPAPPPAPSPTPSLEAVPPHLMRAVDLGICGPSEVASASPAPIVSDSASLKRINTQPEYADAPMTVLIGLDPANKALIRCIVSMPDMAYAAASLEAIDGLVFSAPLAPNHAAAAGRYLVTILTVDGKPVIQPPPQLPILPRCPDDPAKGEEDPALAPRPIHREAAVYPEDALNQGLEGEVVVVLDIFSNGVATPKCLAESTPPGWFEYEAVKAVAQYRFPEGTERGSYVITIKFRLED